MTGRGGRVGNRLTALPRAVDNQVFFGMCSPARDSSAGYHAVRLHSPYSIHKTNRRELGSVGSLARGGPNARISLPRESFCVR